jgi:acyl-coenzyme A thioesterase PaaI-like protein
MSETSHTLSPEVFAEAIKRSRSVYGRASGLWIDRVEPGGQAWATLPFRPVFVGDSRAGVLHGGVVTAMLDECCGTAVQLAMDRPRQIATLDLRIDHQRAAAPEQALKAHSVCNRVTRSIAFVRAYAYQEDEASPVATATACFMIADAKLGRGRDMISQGYLNYRERYPLEIPPQAPDEAFAHSPFAQCLGFRMQGDGTVVMPFSPKIIGNPVLPALHGGMTATLLETAAAVGIRRELGISAPLKPVGLTVNYLRSGRALDTYASVSIVKQGRRVVAFDARAWQDDPQKPIASAFGHFMLRRVDGGDGQ